MKQVDIDKIIVGKRLREGYYKTDIHEMVVSMRTFGQLVPLVVRRNSDGTYTLIAGERRLLAAKKLGWKQISVVEREADDEEATCLEAVENLHRRNFTWQEEVKALKALHESMAKKAEKENRPWTLEHTAQVVGCSKATVSRDLQLADNLEVIPGLSERPTKKSAQNFARRQLDFAVRQYIAKQELDKAMGSYYKLHVGDCVEVMKKELSDESVDLIVTDPPFGIDMHTELTCWKSWKGMIYDDSHKSYRELMKNFFQEAFRVLRPGRHCYVLCGWEWIFYLMELAESCGFVCPGVPGVWVRGVGGWRRHMDRLCSNYYQILFAAKPYPETNKWQDMNGYCDAAFYDITRVSSVRRHPAEAPVELFQRFIQLSSVKHEVVLDPFCGSGSCGVAAIYEKRRFIGIDIEPKWIQLTKLRIEEAIGGQQK